MDRAGSSKQNLKKKNTQKIHAFTAMHCNPPAGVPKEHRSAFKRVRGKPGASQPSRAVDARCPLANYCAACIVHYNPTRRPSTSARRARPPPTPCTTPADLHPCCAGCAYRLSCCSAWRQRLKKIICRAIYAKGAASKRYCLRLMALNALDRIFSR